MSDNQNLHKANKAKQDEFYTQLSDIENELKYYREYFKEKIVLCNCDDPYESNFFKYFVNSFNKLGLKKLIATCYDGSPIAGTQLSFEDIKVEKYKEKKAYKIEITEVKDENGDGAIDITDVEYLIKNKNNILTMLKGNGDFNSNECIELLKQADIVVTNPPFSLFRDYVAQLMEYEKKFIIIGNINAITYKEVFPLIREDKIWIGCSIHSGDREFMVPVQSIDMNKFTGEIRNGKYFQRVMGVRWYTNLDYKERHEKLILYKNYNKEEYPKYDEYDAINVDHTKDIPCDYSGKIGVPISFMDKYNPEQFEILGLDRYIEDNPNYGRRFKINGKETYARIIIKKR